MYSREEENQLPNPRAHMVSTNIEEKLSEKPGLMFSWEEIN